MLVHLKFSHGSLMFGPFSFSIVYVCVHMRHFEQFLLLHLQVHHLFLCSVQPAVSPDQCVFSQLLQFSSEQSPLEEAGGWVTAGESVPRGGFT